MVINDIITKFLIERPYYGYLSTIVAFQEDENVSEIITHTVPRVIICYNPSWFDELSDHYKIGIILHELNHIILLHQHRVGQRDLKIWSVACDIAVNQLIESKYLHDSAITIDKIEKRLNIQLSKNKFAEYYYDELMRIDEMASFIGSEDDIIVVFDGDDKMSASKLSEEKASKVDLENLKNNLFSNTEQAFSEGEIPDGISDEICDVYQDVKVNWRRVIKKFLTGRGKIQIRKSYKRKSRRFDFLPGTKRSVGSTILLAIDESGSISDKMIMNFYNELQDINKITGAQIYVTRFDTSCSKPVLLNSFLSENNREKRGGTNFGPVFELADSLGIHQVIVFTDGQGEYPESVNQNTLWVIIDYATKKVPFGEIVNYER